VGLMMSGLIVGFGTSSALANEHMVNMVVKS
jgi:hypothetical protein